ncbi:MAG TPA: Maf family protein [Ktedonobacterales bacterium]|nr:Maf family protein [Ktedonobacterales bacterium]
MTPTTPLYLASASPRRSQLLSLAGIPFDRYVIPVDEDALTAAYQGPLGLLGEYLARLKAEAAYTMLQADERPLGYVLASDTTVLLGDRSLPKPRDLAEATMMLRTLRGREHVVATGVALIDPFANAGAEKPARYIMRSATAATRVRMRAYSDEEIAAYVATGDPLDKAGAYSIQHPGFQPVMSLAGCHLGVIGLPLCLVSALLTQAGVAQSHQIGRAACPWSPACTAPMPSPADIHMS